MKLFPLHLIPVHTTINFMRYRHIALAVMWVFFASSLALVAVKGFNLALDFTGGTVIEARFRQSADIDQVRHRLIQSGYPNVQVQNFGSGTDVLVRLQLHKETGRDPITQQASQERIAQQIVAAMGDAANPASLLRHEYVGPQIGKELTKNGIYAAIFVIVGFLIYISVRFEWKFAVVASVTTLFDVMVTAGFFSVSGYEFDLNTLAGLLAVMGFSINDTIVVFDRVRENFKQSRLTPFEIMNRSINQTLSRTIITSFVFFLSVLALYLFGGGSLEGLAVTQMIGTITGTLSSIFLACPMLTVGRLKVSRADLMPKAKDLDALKRRP